jgi:uncharacterized membrane protein YkvI
MRLKVLENWRILIVLVALDRIFTVLLISKGGVELNPLIGLTYPYGLLIMIVPFLIAVYYLRDNKKITRYTSYIWIFIVCFNAVQWIVSLFL